MDEVPGTDYGGSNEVLRVFGEVVLFLVRYRASWVRVKVFWGEVHGVLG